MASSNGTITFAPKTIESLQTVVPSKPTNPRWSYQVTFDKTCRTNIFQRCLHVILYYKSTSSGDSGRLLAGWSKESLGKALLEQPSFAGRLRHRESGDDKFEIVLNDSGVRLYEAKIDISLDEFMSFDDGEAQLVHWEDIDERNPQFCPLLYVQVGACNDTDKIIISDSSNLLVSNFKCGGYSIGFSCSTILTDPFTMTSFIKKWANIHKNIVTYSEIPKLPLFYSPIICKIGCAPMNENGTFVYSKNKGLTSIIKVTIEGMNLDQKELTGLCINEVVQIQEIVKLPAVFCLYTKERSNEIKVDLITSKNESVVKSASSVLSMLNGASWGKYFGADEICLHGENKPIRVSSWINSIEDEGLVMVIPIPDKGKSENQIIIVTI